MTSGVNVIPLPISLPEFLDACPPLRLLLLGAVCKSLHALVVTDNFWRQRLVRVPPLSYCVTLPLGYQAVFRSAPFLACYPRRLRVDLTKHTEEGLLTLNPNHDPDWLQQQIWNKRTAHVRKKERFCSTIKVMLILGRRNYQVEACFGITQYRPFSRFYLAQYARILRDNPHVHPEVLKPYYALVEYLPHSSHGFHGPFALFRGTKTFSQRQTEAGLPFNGTTWLYSRVHSNHKITALELSKFPKKNKHMVFSAFLVLQRSERFMMYHTTCNLIQQSFSDIITFEIKCFEKYQQHLDLEDTTIDLTTKSLILRLFLVLDRLGTLRTCRLPNRRFFQEKERLENRLHQLYNKLGEPATTKWKAMFATFVARDKILLPSAHPPAALQCGSVSTTMIQ